LIMEKKRGLGVGTPGKKFHLKGEGKKGKENVPLEGGGKRQIAFWEKQGKSRQLIEEISDNSGEPGDE